MAEELAPSPWNFEVPQPVLRAELPPEHVALAFDRGPDPLDCGFLLAGGVLATLPGKVRLPYDDEDAEGEDEGEGDVARA